MLPGASDFLEAAPCEKQGLHMDPAAFLVQVRRRLLVPVYDNDAWCPQCDCVLDAAGRHPGMCCAGGDRTRRHHAVRNLVCNFAAEAGLRPELEKPDLLPPDPEKPDSHGRRPADVFLPSWCHGAPAAFDLAVSSPQRQEALQLVALGPGKAVQAYEHTKRQHLHTEAMCKQQGLVFLPLVAEPSGGWGPTAVMVLKRMARAAEHRRGLPKGCLFRSWLQRLSVALRTADSMAALRRESDSRAYDRDAFM